MWAKIKAFFAILKGLLDLSRYLRDYRERQALKKDRQKAKARQQAVDDLKEAKTDEEIFDAQKRIVDNKP